MARRGPDGEGEWLSQNGRVGLAHRRLSIIDLSDGGAQPMVSDDGALVVTFNGEIYNYRELRSHLEAHGARFRSSSDTEVLLHLYAQKGTDMLRDLRGMFAFALWDERRKKLILARDPYGIKPLYYATNERTLRAASQVKALQAGGSLSKKTEPAAMAGFYLLGSVPEPWTIYEGVFSVPAGTYICADARGLTEPRSFCDIAAVMAEATNLTDLPTQSQATELLIEAFRESVHSHMVADVPVGVFLSSGMDSCALGALAAGVSEGLKAITLGFEEYIGTPQDETPLAAEVARQYGLRHKVERISDRDFKGFLPSFFADMDQPTIDGVNTWLVSRAARAEGWKVALSGIGGDELLGGYSSFVDVPRWKKKLAIPASVPLLGACFQWVGALLAPYLPSLSPKFPGLVRYGGTMAGAYMLKRGLFLPEDLPELMGGDFAAEGLRRLQPLAALGAPLAGKQWSNSGFQVSALESSHYMRNQLLRDTDWTGMAHSMEIRTPLADIQLLRRAVPALAALGHQHKQALAVAPAMPLPASVRFRPKTGFDVPIAAWHLESEHDTWRRLPKLNKPGCHWSRRWAYSVMEEWCSQ